MDVNNEEYSCRYSWCVWNMYVYTTKCKKMILNSERLAEHPFAVRNTQHPTTKKKNQQSIIF